MSDALDAAIRAAMREQDCESYANCADGASLCNPHDGDDCDVWDEGRDVCSVVARAVTVGFEAGRRDALTQASQEVSAAANHALEGVGSSWGDEAYERAVNAARIAYGNAHSAVRALLSTTKEAKP